MNNVIRAGVGYNQALLVPSMNQFALVQVTKVKTNNDKHLPLGKHDLMPKNEYILGNRLTARACKAGYCLIAAADNVHQRPAI